MDARELLAATLQNAVALFIIIDPMGVLPIFAALVRDMDRPTRGRTVNLGVAVAVAILIVFATIGRPVLGLFGVGLAELMIAGGVMLALIGLDEIFGIIHSRETRREDIGIVPLACPLLAGPGAIVTTMLMMQRTPSPYNFIIVFASIILAMGASWAFFYYSGFFLRVLGSRGSLILAKLMGILITAIGTHFVMQGIADFWTNLR